ncbi:MAG TPA: hypothetical protein VMG08_18065 [Allosphingosinicella sp.]|nr:hypothetical protein [Allosphingosinicella sp.]
MAFFNAVAQAAQQFIGQRYSFIYGRRSGWLGRLAHRNRSETQPFCSELVATVFKSLGMPISDRPVDRVLPIDIELACTGPDWTEVTDDYYLTPLPPELGRATFSAEGREIPFSEIFDDEERFHPGFEAAVEQFRLVFRTVATAAEAMELGLQLNTARLQQAQLLYDHPHPLFENDATLARSALHILQTPPGLGTAMLLSTTVSGGLRKLFPDAQLEKPFEALPSLSEIEQREIAMDLTGVRASLLTAIATMRVLCRVTNIPGFEDVALDGVDLEAARGTIKAVPALTDAAFNELGSHLQQIRQLGGPFGDVGDLMVEAIRLQRLVTLLRDGA